jgi:hypothetical protein
LVAYGYGVPPWWVDTTPGAEAWALNIVVTATVGRKQVFTDCLGNLSTLKRGSTWATASNRRYARIWGSTFSALDGNNNDGRWLIWIPAHTAKKQIGVATRSDGVHISALDHKANWLVDEPAKYAANVTRLPKHVRQLFASAAVAVEHSAAMVGIQCKAANHCEVEVLQENGETVKVVLRDSTPLAVAARHAVSHEQRRLKAAAASAAALAKIQRVIDGDTEARECRSMAREEARTRLHGHRIAAAFLCGQDLDDGDVTGDIGSGLGTPAAALLRLATHDTVFTACGAPIAVGRKRAARANNEAQRANVAKQNARRGAILKAETAARKGAIQAHASESTADRHIRRRGTATATDQAQASGSTGASGTIHTDTALVGATDDTRLVGAVAEWWQRKRKSPESCTGSGFKRYRLNSKTRDV